MKVSSRILFDSGSQRTYASEAVWKTPKLKTIRTERVPVVIKTFGQADNSDLQKLDTV